MGNVEAHDFAPVRADERKVLNLSRKVTPKQYVKHLNGEYHEACLTELPWSIRDSVSLYEAMTASFNALTELPVELPLRLPHLSSLDLSHNQLRSLPESFGLLFHLSEIQLQHNRLGALPESFLHLVKLEKIDLSHNEIRHLPEKIGGMERLSRLNVSHNKLKTLPLSLGSPLCRVHLLLAGQNRLESPPQAVCEEGSTSTLEYLRRMHTASCKEYPLQGSDVPLLVFPRHCANKLEPSVSNPHSAQIQYIQEQTHTSHTTNRIKAPLLPPPDVTTLTPFQLRDRIIGLIYGAAIGDAIGLACRWMSDDECVFHYGCDNDFVYNKIVQDQHRVLWRQGDWTSNFDQFMVCLESLVNWAGVVDELEFARRLQAWAHHGFPELGDSASIVTSEVLREVLRQPNFTVDPHGAAYTVYHENNKLENAIGTNSNPTSTDPSNHSISNIANNINSNAPALHTGSEGQSDSHSPHLPHNSNTSRRLSSSSSLSSLSLCGHVEVAQKLVFISPCQIFGEDNGAVVRASILGVPNFHQLEEVEGNAVRICKTTHHSDKAVTSCVFVSLLISLILQGKMDSAETDHGQQEEEKDEERKVEKLVSIAMERASAHLKDDAAREEFLALRKITSLDRFKARESSCMSHTYKPAEAAMVALYWPSDYRSFICSLTKLAGDSNSNCCVGGAILGCRQGYSRLPHTWVEGLRKRQVNWLNAKINHLLDIVGLP
ncbi:plant intracellular ras-group-related lrr protein 1 [Plakobranchus ocellatus]|uniref:Plant intracellular ras-group-related lrr protein 1 n=1 Tax=Plakobranchus ocellatus TaxID=259542 RepID=A0AAV4CBU2_9GAST|nr:plant intracellular ras-group-related lrr protein 1 [Plakobranchus ocellatus]